jgi:hypothetical protein
MPYAIIAVVFLAIMGGDEIDDSAAAAIGFEKCKSGSTSAQRARAGCQKYGSFLDQIQEKPYFVCGFFT